MISIRPTEEIDHAACLAVARTLTEWFTEDAQERAVPVDMKHQRGFLAESSGRVVGFITLFVAEGRLNIGWRAVHRDHHRRGIGGRLVARAEELAV